MSVAARDLHGVVVEIDDRLPGRPSSVLLDAFPAAPGAPAALRIALEVAPSPRPAPAGEPAYFHFAIRAVRGRAGTALWDGASVLSLSSGTGIRGEVHASSLADPRAFAHGMLLLALFEALRAHGLFQLHGAALRAPGGDLLVAGGSGAGKSTTTLALAAAGLAVTGDDTVLLARRDARPALLALPRAFHVGEAAARAFPALTPFLGPRFGETGKRFLDADGALGRAHLRAAGPPRAILFPRVVAAAETTRLEPVAAADALGRLIEASALLVVDGAARVPEQLALLAELSDGARAYSVSLGHDLLRDPRRWAWRLLAEVGLDG